MNIELLFYEDEKLNEFKKWVEKNKLDYELNDEIIKVFGLNEYDNNYRSLNFYIEFFNDDGDYCYIDLKENEVANWKISLS